MLNSKGYSFWLIQDHGTEVLLPVPPEEIKISNKAKNQTYNIDGLGDVTFIQTPNLKEFSFSSELPMYWYRACVTKNIKKPSVYESKINKMKNHGPVKFVVPRTKINMYVTIEDFSTSEKGGDVGTLYYSMTLREYRHAEPRKVTPVTTTTAEVSSQIVAVISDVASRVDTRVASSTYTVAQGDTLWKIAKDKLGDGNRYSEIYNLNSGIISNQDLIYPGQVLTLPS